MKGKCSSSWEELSILSRVSNKGDVLPSESKLICCDFYRVYRVEEYIIQVWLENDCPLVMSVIISSHHSINQSPIYTLSRSPNSLILEIPSELCSLSFHSENDLRILSKVCAGKIQPLRNFQPFWALSLEPGMFSKSFASHGCHLLLHDPLLLCHLSWRRFHPALSIFERIFLLCTDRRS